MSRSAGSPWKCSPRRLARDAMAASIGTASSPRQSTAACHLVTHPPRGARRASGRPPQSRRTLRAKVRERPTRLQHQRPAAAWACRSTSARPIRRWRAFVCQAEALLVAQSAPDRRRHGLGWRHPETASPPAPPPGQNGRAITLRISLARPKSPGPHHGGPVPPTACPGCSGVGCLGVGGAQRALTLRAPSRSRGAPKTALLSQHHPRLLRVVTVRKCVVPDAR